MLTAAFPELSAVAPSPADLSPSSALGEGEAGGPQASTASFPYTIEGDHFALNGETVFLNIIDYSPLEPGQSVVDPINESRISDDLSRLSAYAADAEDPLVLRVYPQPIATLPIRMPQSFYDGARDLGIWIIRDIYFPDGFQSPNAINSGKAAIDSVIAEVEAVGGFDRIFAWEFGDEFQANGGDIGVLETFLTAMRDHIKLRMAEPGREAFSDWVTWAAWPPADPLHTDGNPISVPSLDYVSFNAYSYDPERIRDHQAGPKTGTPFAGYLAALKDRFPGKPLVVSESGLPDSPSAVGLNQSRLSPLYPNYRRGALSSEQVAEGLADRYWDARLSGSIAGFGVFEWFDEWWKTGNPASQADHPEEYFGLGRFDAGELRYKLQQQTIHDLYTLDFGANSFSVNLTADNTSLSPLDSTTLHANVTPGSSGPVRFRWETSRGFIAGDSSTVEFYAGEHALGPAEVTVVAIDGNGDVAQASLSIDIAATGPPTIELLTFGTQRSSGRVANIDLTQNKVVLYVKTDNFYVQPFADMPSIWVGADGYWWSENHVNVAHTPTLYAWIVPNTFDPPAVMFAAPPGNLAEAVQPLPITDTDNDLLPDALEPIMGQDRYDDPDSDGANHLEELLLGSNPSIPDNDVDTDGLEDTWERRYFGRLIYGPLDDPDNDGLTNIQEANLGIHPGRTAVDRDQDGLPDAWEIEFLTSLDQGAGDDANFDGVTNLEEYELGVVPNIQLDYGDAPDPAFPTRLASDGARHLLGSAVLLGSSVDDDPDGQPDGTSTGDDGDGHDDEDGIVSMSNFLTGQPASIGVSAPAGGELDVWLDFNGDGTFDHPGEHASAGVSVTLTPGVNTVNFGVPLDAVAGPATARLRISSAGGLPPTGLADDGEVEDHEVLIERVFIVNSTSDAGDNDLGDDICDTGGFVGAALECTLRAAIEQANATPNVAAVPDRIHFAIPGGGGHTMSPSSPLPAVTDAVTIDGTTQPTYAATPLVEVDGSGAGAGVHGLTITSGGSTVLGLSINRFGGSGILLSEGGGNTIQQNMIGTNPAGSIASGNASHGVTLFNSAGNLLGGPTANDANVISGNSGHGVFITRAGSTGNEVKSNMIGVGANGATQLGNGGAGVRIDQDASGNSIGGSGNVISENSRGGVVIVGSGTTDNTVAGNKIGTDSTGLLDRGNRANGVSIENAPANKIGVPGDGNLISGNANNGVFITGVAASGNFVQGNHIGLDMTGDGALPNGLDGINMVDAPSNTLGGAVAGAGNVVSGNDDSGIFIVGAGATANHIEGNFIGTNSSGTSAVANLQFGVVLRDAPNNTVGGTAAGARNVVSGNLQHGVAILETNATGNVVIGNLIGTDTTGTVDVGNALAGVLVWKAPGNRIGGLTASERNIVSGNDLFGVRIATSLATNNLVQGNYIGTDISGTAALPNSDSGVHVANSQNGTIGGTAAGARNIISANGNHGVVIVGAGALGNQVEGNYIGLDATGTAPLGNEATGVRIAAGAHGNTVGGDAGNVIADNGEDGVHVNDVGTRNNTVSNNRIGTDFTGTVDLGNTRQGISIFQAHTNLVELNLISGNEQFGVTMTGSAATGNEVRSNKIGTDDSGTSGLGNSRGGVYVAAPNNMIGGAGPGDGNTIAHHTGIGIAVAGASATGNAIRRNSIFSNTGLGIDLGFDLRTPNDPEDADEGPNRLQNFPVIASAVLDGALTIDYSVPSTPANADYGLAIEFFLADAGGAQGQTYLGSDTYLAGEATISKQITIAAGSAIVGQRIVATATDTNGNTSEFSDSVVIGPPLPAGEGEGAAADPSPANRLTLAPLHRQTQEPSQWRRPTRGTRRLATDVGNATRGFASLAIPRERAVPSAAEVDRLLAAELDALLPSTDVEHLLSGLVGG